MGLAMVDKVDMFPNFAQNVNSFRSRWVFLTSTPPHRHSPISLKPPFYTKSGPQGQRSRLELAAGLAIPRFRRGGRLDPGAALAPRAENG